MDDINTLHLYNNLVYDINERKERDYVVNYQQYLICKAYKHNNTDNRVLRRKRE